jgi:ankyrin repeat protein
MLVLLACALVGTRANAQADDLVSAVGKADFARVKALLHAKANVNARDDHGNTPLIWATVAGSPEMAEARRHATRLKMVRLLLAAGADVNFRDGLGNTALTEASFSGSREMLRALLDAGADVNARNGHGATPLMRASESGNLEALRTLFEVKADVNAKDDQGFTALMLASQSGKMEVVRELLGAQADVRAKSANGLTASKLAWQNGHAEVARVVDTQADGNPMAKNGSAPNIAESSNAATPPSSRARHYTCTSEIQEKTRKGKKVTTIVNKLIVEFWTNGPLTTFDSRFGSQPEVVNMSYGERGFSAHKSVSDPELTAAESAVSALDPATQLPSAWRFSFHWVRKPAGSRDNGHSETALESDTKSSAYGDINILSPFFLRSAQNGPACVWRME